MPARRLEVGPLLVLAGAIVLVIALFLNWYTPGLSAWDVFELLDLVLLGLAVAGGLAAVSALGGLATGPDTSALPWICGAALILVLATVIDAPPAAGASDTDSGLWIALTGAALMALGAVLVAARVRISLDVEGRRRRVSAVESRRPREAAPRRAYDDAEPSGRRPREDDAPVHRAWDGEDDAPSRRPWEDDEVREDDGPTQVEREIGPPSFEDDPRRDS